MLVNEAMTTDVALVSPDQSIGEAARLMADFDIGMLPVGVNDATSTIARAGTELGQHGVAELLHAGDSALCKLNDPPRDDLVVRTLRGAFAGATVNDRDDFIIGVRHRPDGLGRERSAA
jgi:CBS domain-containing protein